MKKIFMPFLGLIFALLIALVITYPMIGMDSKDIAVGIVNLDEGFDSPDGNVNAGDEFFKKMKESTSMLVFDEFDSEKSLNDAFDDSKYYAIFVIPSDFTVSNLSGVGSKILVKVNEGKHPMVTSMLNQMISNLNQNDNFDVVSVNSISDYGFKAMVLPILLVLFTLIPSVVTSLFIGQSRWNYLFQLLYGLIVSLIIGFVATLCVTFIADVDAFVLDTVLYLSLVSFAFICFTLGAVNLFGKKGAILTGILFALGMCLIQLPFEFLPVGTQYVVASWEPLRYVGDGIREVLYQGKGFVNSAFVALIIMIFIGVLLGVIGVFKNDAKRSYK